MNEEKDLVVAYLAKHIPETLKEHLPKVFDRPEWDFDVRIGEVEIYRRRVFVNMRLRFSFPQKEERKMCELYDEKGKETKKEYTLQKEVKNMARFRGFIRNETDESPAWEVEATKTADAEEYLTVWVHGRDGGASITLSLEDGEEHIRLTIGGPGYDASFNTLIACGPLKDVRFQMAEDSVASRPIRLPLVVCKEAE